MTNDDHKGLNTDIFDVTFNINVLSLVRTLWTPPLHTQIKLTFAVSFLCSILFVRGKLEFREGV